MINYQVIGITVEGVLLTATWSRKEAAQQDYRRKFRNKQQYRYICLAKQTWNTGDGTLTDAVIQEEYMDLLNSL